MIRNQELRKIKKRLMSENVAVLFLNFIDLRGQVRTKIIYTRELLHNFNGFFRDGVSVTGSLVDELQTRSEFFIIKPIPETFTIITWASAGDSKMAFVLCELCNTSFDSRNVVQKLNSRFKEFQLEPMCGMGITYRLQNLRDEEKLAGFYQSFPGSELDTFNQGLTRTLLSSGFDIEFIVPSGPGYCHIAFMSNDLLKSLDNNALGKWVAYSYMLSKRCSMIFSKPFSSAAPLHLSIWNGQRTVNLFYDQHDRYEFSSLGYSFMAGVLHYFDEILAVIVATAGALPKINYRKRLSFIDDDSIISAPCFFTERKKKVHSGWSKRCVFRGVDDSANLYLVSSCIFAAGLEGIRSSWTVEDNTDENYGVDSSSLLEKQRKLRKCQLFVDLLGEPILNVLNDRLNVARKVKNGRKN